MSKKLAFIAFCISLFICSDAFCDGHKKTPEQIADQARKAEKTEETSRQVWASINGLRAASLLSPQKKAELHTCVMSKVDPLAGMMLSDRAFLAAVTACGSASAR